MEEIHRALVMGSMDLESAQGELGGEILELGPAERSELRAEMPPKAIELLVQIPEAGFTVPYQQARALHIVQLLRREEPTALDFEQAQERVRDDYLRRFT